MAVQEDRLATNVAVVRHLLDALRASVEPLLDRWSLTDRELLDHIDRIDQLLDNLTARR